MTSIYSSHLDNIRISVSQEQQSNRYNQQTMKVPWIRREAKHPTPKKSPSLRAQQAIMILQNWRQSIPLDNIRISISQLQEWSQQTRKFSRIRRKATSKPDLFSMSESTKRNHLPLWTRSQAIQMLSSTQIRTGSSRHLPILLRPGCLCYWHFIHWQGGSPLDGNQNISVAIWNRKAAVQQRFEDPVAELIADQMRKKLLLILLPSSTAGSNSFSLYAFFEI